MPKAAKYTSDYFKDAAGKSQWVNIEVLQDTQDEIRKNSHSQEINGRWVPPSHAGYIGITGLYRNGEAVQFNDSEKAEIKSLPGIDPERIAGFPGELRLEPLKECDAFDVAAVLLKYLHDKNCLTYGQWTEAHTKLGLTKDPREAPATQSPTSPSSPVIGRP